jgi:hypothetical protein
VSDECISRRSISTFQKQQRIHNRPFVLSVGTPDADAKTNPANLTHNWSIRRATEAENVDEKRCDRVNMTHSIGVARLRAVQVEETFYAMLVLSGSAISQAADADFYP